MKPVYVSRDWRMGMMMYQPLRTVILPMTLPSISFVNMPNFSFPVAVWRGDGQCYICFDLSHVPPKWERAEEMDAK